VLSGIVIGKQGACCAFASLKAKKLIAAHNSKTLKHFPSIVCQNCSHLCLNQKIKAIIAQLFIKGRLAWYLNTCYQIISLLLNYEQ
jgi:hypothetical protein